MVKAQSQPLQHFIGCARPAKLRRILLYGIMDAGLWHRLRESVGVFVNPRDCGSCRSPRTAWLGQPSRNVYTFDQIGHARNSCDA